MIIQYVAYNLQSYVLDVMHIAYAGTYFIMTSIHSNHIFNGYALIQFHLFLEFQSRL